MGDGWFGKGFDTKTFTPPPEGGGGKDPYNRSRFIIKQGEEKKVLMIENLSEGFRIVEHQLWDPKNNQPWFIPCLAAQENPQECHLCAEGAPATRALLMTVIDRHGYQLRRGKDAGKQVPNVKRLFVIPERLLGLFILREKKYKGLKGLEFDVTRVDRFAKLGDEWSPRTGDDDRILRYTADMLKAEKIDAVPFEYDKIVPLGMTTAEQKAFCQSHPTATWKREFSDSGDSDAGSSGGGGDTPPAGGVEEPQGEDQIPF